MPIAPKSKIIQCSTKTYCSTMTNSDDAVTVLSLRTSLMMTK